MCSHKLQLRAACATHPSNKTKKERKKEKYIGRENVMLSKD